ncbi:hypothetical protein [Nocardioides sp.]|uniref:hypothetical protein n=1 Tax=Nocardioides sp. TaxID=35761 RepID=UPI0026192398|nr:hypothetical protein [Nocardioides sp.]MCW2735481.1 hypothetical protein [Nocardioides sp.]
MPGGRLVLHVGAMKSGTTFVQSRLFAHRELLQERGIRVPGRRRRSQVLAVQQLLRGGGPMWDKHAAAVSRHDGTSVISVELLGPAPTAVVQALRDGVDAEVEVVLTARDLNRSVPAMWQETVQNGRSWGWHDYVIGARTDRPSARRGAPATEPGRAFWIQQDLVRLARTWASVFGPERVTVVTVPPPGSAPELLWWRFAGVVGPELDGLTSAPDPNESLGAASATAMRRLNELLDAEGLLFPQGHQLRKRLLTKQVLAARKSAEPAIGLGVLPWVTEEADAQRRGLVDLGVRLVGDWADLTPVDVPGIDPETLDDREVGEAALAGLAGLLAALTRSAGPDADPA